jgi:hypothetical protein
MKRPLKLRMPNRRRAAAPPVIPSTSPIVGLPPDYGGPGMPPEPGMMGDTSTGYGARGGTAGPPPKLSSLRNIGRLMRGRKRM